MQGIRQQFVTDQKVQFLLARLGGGGDNENTSSVESLNVAKEIESRCKTVEEEDSEQIEEAWGDVSGARLSPDEVKRVRQEEVDYIHKMNVYTNVPTIECYKRTENAPIIVRWIDVSKGNSEKSNYRSRFVAPEISIHKRQGLFAAIPPLEALTLIVSISASSDKGELVRVNDTSRAFLHDQVNRDAYARLPAEDLQPGEEELCGKLIFSIHGTRGTAQKLQLE